MKKLDIHNLIYNVIGVLAIIFIIFLIAFIILGLIFAGLQLHNMLDSNLQTAVIGFFGLAFVGGFSSFIVFMTFSFLYKEIFDMLDKSK